MWDIEVLAFVLCISKLVAHATNPADRRSASQISRASIDTFGAAMQPEAITKIYMNVTARKDCFLQGYGEKQSRMRWQSCDISVTNIRLEHQEQLKTAA